MRGHDERVRSVAFDATGRRLFSGGGASVVRAWDVVEGRCVDELLGHSSGIWSSRPVRTTRWRRPGGEDGSVRVWDLPSGASTQGWPERPYEGTGIAGVKGMLPTEVSTWISLGADASSASRAGQRKRKSPLPTSRGRRPASRLSIGDACRPTYGRRLQQPAMPIGVRTSRHPQVSSRCDRAARCRSTTGGGQIGTGALAKVPS
ncbi:hypothetical protein [Jiella sp. R10]|uniref:hypothetical protein n=1 Tax=Antarcticirhabdus aurantiaca TaxID=2606717 RepID=UPI00131BE267